MATAPNPVPVPEAPKRSPWRHVWRGVLVVVALLALLVGGAAWYASTPQFANRVRTELIAVLERATGGRVELGAFRWRVLHLEFEADDLTIHGLEGPGEVPYAHVDRAFVRVKILSFFQPKVRLNYLGVTHPVFHLIVNPDGSTNQPHPKIASTSNKPITDTIFDLAAERAEITDGMALINQRAVPLNFSANQVAVAVTYLPAPLGAKDPKTEERYSGRIHIEDLTAQRGKFSPVHSKLDMQISLGRNEADLQSLRLQTGPSVLDAKASLKNFADPRWNLETQGKVDMREVEALADIDGLSDGLVALQLSGQGAKAAFTLDGNADVKRAAYHAGSFHIVGASASTQIHLTQDELRLTKAHTTLAQGGVVDAELSIVNWLHANASKKQKGTIRADIRNVSLLSIMSLVAPGQYDDLGFDTAATGKGQVDWLGSALDLRAAAQVQLVPTGHSGAGETPLDGTVDAEYSNASGMVNIHHLDAHTPGMQLQVNGALGAYPITRPSAMQVQLATTDLGEFDHILKTLGVAARGKAGVQVIPVALHGEAQFQGTITQSILDPDVKGSLAVTNFDLDFREPETGTPSLQQVSATAPAPQTGLQTVHWDSFHAQAEYSSSLIAVQQGVLQRGKTTVQLSGELHAHEISAHHFAFDEASAIRADVHVQDAPISDLLMMAGQNLPVTGTLNLQAHVDGELGNLNGGGHAAIAGGEIDGEPYRSLNTDLRFAGKEIGATHLVFLMDGGQISGDGGYNLTTQGFHFNAHGTGFELAHLQHLKNSKYPMAGMLTFDAQGSGTPSAPQLQANLHLTNFNFADKTSGSIDAEAHTQGRTLLLNANAHMSNAQAQVQGQMEVNGDYQTQAKLTLTSLDVDPVLQAFNVRGVTVHSSIAGVVTVTGPLRYPKKMSGDAMLQQVAVALSGIPLKTDGPLHATLSGGRLHLDPVHIMGDDTNLHAQGSVGFNGNGRDLDLHADGSVNMKLMQTLDGGLTSSGHVDFNIDAEGTFSRPGLKGQVKLTNVAMALQDFPNGLSQINGTLAFDQDRLDVKDMTAVSGGGQLRLGGFITYQQGLYGDLNATAKDVRIRYPQGVSSMADAKVRLQGTQSAMQLSGNVTITRFVIGSDLDLASFNSSTGSVSLPVDPNSPSSHVRLDVHVRSAPQLDFQNSYAKLAGDVDLRLRGTLAQPSVLGHISVTEGNATFAGTKYELQHGDIYFTNPLRIDPVIDLSATARVEDYDITIGLNGTPSSKLAPTFRSEPPLSEPDIFALLALGRTQEEQQIYANMQSQAGVNSTADALLGGALNATVSSRIQKLFGGGSVKIDPTFVSGTGNSSARITVEQQVSKNATLTYATNVNSTAQQLIQGQWNVTENLSVLAVRDESGVFSLIFKIRRRYR
jgi:translocation and assembly module TamB